jgi:Tfp pilus assembly protein PilF
MDRQTANSLRKAASLLKAGDAKAARAISKILKANPDHEQAWYLLSFAVQTRRGQINVLRQTLRINPNHV